MAIILSGTTITNSAGPLPIVSGGTNATTAQDAINNLLPSQTGNSGQFLTTDGTNTSWAAVSSGGTVPTYVISVTTNTGSPSSLNPAGPSNDGSSGIWASGSEIVPATGYSYSVPNAQTIFLPNGTLTYRVTLINQIYATNASSGNWPVTYSGVYGSGVNESNTNASLYIITAMTNSDADQFEAQQIIWTDEFIVQGQATVTPYIYFKQNLSQQGVNNLGLIYSCQVSVQAIS